MRIGIDVGGTNTDAVLMDGRRVVAWAKSPTTPDVTGGMLAALRALLAQAPDVTPARDISAVMIGTTHFTNAVVERKRLAPTAAVRLGAPATAALPPMVDWPDDLRAAIGGRGYLIEGGHEFDGREINPLDEKRLRELARQLTDEGIEAVSVTGVFSPVTPAHEERAAAILRDAAPGLHVTQSHEIGRVGLLERENATILNSSLVRLAGQMTQALRDALAGMQLTCPFYLSQNDGTLMNAEYAARFPVLTFSSGPTNSMRGAAFLSDVKEGIVVDIGGTTSDVGMLRHGFPREAGASVEVGGVRTNFRMPDVYSFGLGGGSLIRREPELSIGPDSVGYRLTEQALVFGGETLTASDIAVAAGLAVMGDPARVAHLDRVFAGQAVQRMRTMLETAIDRMKLAADPVPVVLVGGGHVLVGDQLAGASVVLRPANCQVANAIGAAIAQVGGEIERVYDLSAMSRTAALDAARQEAVDRARAAGAAPSSIEIVEVEEVPLTYLPSNATRIHVKAVGDLAA
ncbi:MAG: hydantoinase/oxoprolinase family protein [Chloroflexi bacterium]|nr:hydantoinase/oxoprolinase family protein [Chloroflexota bacterium]